MIDDDDPRLIALGQALHERKRWPSKPDMWFKGNDGIDLALAGAEILLYSLKALLHERHISGVVSMSLGPERGDADP